ncbi:hypothetical protein TRAPUB_11453 [Trametes pubescens]|uniref:HAT C-terminal dimerisation domain-containing protein n=1 Tax=Trametes pubescens TaxID=154538 RepID=A0A1M2VWL0_TRAPU|nr:hypothetical protein TRAPUB_11453 [Trametes pubescens]
MAVGTKRAKAKKAGKAVKANKAASTQKDSQPSTSRRGTGRDKPGPNKSATAKSNLKNAETQSNEEERPTKRTRTRQYQKATVEDADNEGDKAMPIVLGSGDEDDSGEDDGDDEPNAKKDKEAEEVEDEEDDDAELEHLKKSWTSAVYAFYKTDIDIQYMDGRRAHIFTCVKTSCKHTVRRYVDTRDGSTGNLKKHALSCWGTVAVERVLETADVSEARKMVMTSLLETGRISVHFQWSKKKGKVTYSHMQHTREETRAELVKWVAESLWPFSIVADRGFLLLVKTRRPGYYVPSPSTVSRDAKTVFTHTRARITRLLQDYDGRLSFATDAWTLPNHRAFVAITVHLEYDGQPICLLLDVVEVAKSHTGVNLAAAFAEVLEEFGIEHKILSVTANNVMSNDTMTEQLGVLLDTFNGNFSRTRCFLHILNLVAKSMLHQFDVKAVGDVEEGNEDVRALLELARELEAEELETMQERQQEQGESESVEENDDKMWVDEVASLDNEEREEFEREVRPVKMVLSKMHHLTFKIVHSTTKVLPAWNAILVEKKLPQRLILCDVRTRWNSTYDMLQVALKYCTAVDTLCSRREHSLRVFELSPEEWTIMQELCDMLEVFKDATLYFSRDTPNLAMVIPAMDHIDNLLTTQTRAFSPLSLPISGALRLAKKTLNQYYKLFDMSVTYRIAMIMHPGHKMRYFENAHWPAGWLKTACKLVREEYDSFYLNQDAADDSDDGGMDNNNDEEAAMEAQPSRKHKRAEPSTVDIKLPLGANIFDHLPSMAGLGNSDDLDELDCYLSAPTEKINDALTWWVERRRTYPKLSCMALDYLSIPDWVWWDLVHAEDVRTASRLCEVNDDGSDYEMADGWDSIACVLKEMNDE